ncbi:tyrosine-type recombinase/integrase [uncultured Akkermansia sp.]|uniref:tyrosine-type recombinase/integrase n=1 Tax=uncultured Akkermansia sp. TaxID=512294 RepID=UPI00265CE95D|nr:tyrosine-type recombinase/integrase [uncultured Akkermansia sp.]
MPRKLSFKPYRKNGKWTIFVPGRITETGRDQYLYFRNKEIAVEEQRKLQDQVASIGERSICLSVEDADELKVIGNLLAGYGVGLRDVVDDWLYVMRELKGTGLSVKSAADALKTRLNEEKSRPLAEIVKEYLKQLKGRSRQYTARVTKFANLMVGAFPELSPDTLTPLDFQKWLEEVTGTDPYYNNVLRGLKPMFTWAVRMGLAVKNPVENVPVKKIITGVPDILTLDQVRKVLAACRDFRGDRSMPELCRLNCSDCLSAVSILLFAGVRPQELTRLTWGDVYLSKRIIKVSEHVSKTSSIRNVQIEKNLYDFLTSLPVRKNSQKIIPSNWVRKWKAIRKAAGIGDLQDVCRHTYASYWLAKNESMDRLLMNMGHTTNKVTLKHYLTACERRDAEIFWRLTPAAQS